jgi:hypothetical protein
MNYSDGEMAPHLLMARSHRFDMQTAPTTGDAEMTVFWEVSHNKVAEAVSFLDRFSCGDNYVAAPSVQTRLIVNPVVDNEAFSGNWRVVKNWFDPQLSGKVMQTRRRGYVTTLLDGSGNVNWSEALLVSGHDHLVFGGQTDDYVVLQWRNLAPGSGPALAAQLVGKGAGTSPDFWTVSYGSTSLGTGWRLLPPHHETAQDGSVSVSVAFAKLGVTVTSYSNIGSLRPTSTVQEACTEDALAARVAALKATAGVTDVSASRDDAGGMCQIRYTVREAQITTLLGAGGAVDWTGAKIVSGHDHLVPDDFVVIGWHNVAPGYGPKLAKELVDKGTGSPPDYWTPMGDENTFGKGWRIMPPQHQTASDGSAVVSVAFVKLAVTVTSYSNINAEIETETVREQWPEDAANARITVLKTEAQVYDVSASRSFETGLVSISYTLRKVGTGSFEYTINRGAASTEYHKVVWGVADLTEINAWTGPQDYTVPAGAAVVRSVSGVTKDSASGKYSYRIMLSAETPSFFTYTVTREDGDTEWHYVAWAQAADAQGNLAGLNWLPPAATGTPTTATAQRSVGSVSRDPVTGRFSYHVVVTNKGAEISTNQAAPNTSFRVRFEKRTMWSVRNNMYWDQDRFVQYKTEVCQFSSFALAEAWIRDGTGNTLVQNVTTGVYTTLPNWPTPDTPMPRLVGKNKWLASRSRIDFTSEWYPYEPT